MPQTIDTAFLDTLAPSFAALFLDRVRQTPDLEAYRFPRGDGWESVTWQQTGRTVEAVAAGLLSIGLHLEQRVGIASGTRYEWILADLGVMCAGGATTTVYPTMNAADTAYILADAECTVVFVENVEQLAKLQQHRAELPGIEHVIIFDGASDGDWVLSFTDLIDRGEELLSQAPLAVLETAATITPEMLATLIYTSGTTGRPKGVRLTHRSWVYEGEALKALGFLYEDDLSFLWLPMAHSFGKVLLSTQIAVGFATAIDGRVDRIIDNLAIIRPTFMGAAPRIFEKAYSRIVTMTEADGGLKQKIFTQAFAVGTEYERRLAAGEPISAGLRIQHRLFDRLVFSKIRNRFGGRVRFFISGAAALNQDIAEWFNAAGILIIEGYGLTECTAGGFVGHTEYNRFGTVGAALPGSEARIGDDGEILIRGPHIMEGYHNLPDETAKVLDAEGWLHTGDKGTIGDDGFLSITGRLKDIFKTSGGKQIAPGAIEATFKAICPYASQFLVFGNEKPYCVALITLDPDAIAGWAADNDVDATDYAAIVAHPAVQQLVAGYVDELNSRLNRWETVKKWSVLDQDLSIETGELTPSMKVKRGLVEDTHAATIAGLYV